jgi:Asp-tRNA(Asn)/Glu-tRNA(Gln) amidotransferase A subunit family amidase
MAPGSDTGGSVRNPAGACGIVGLKPTYGLISRRGVFPLSFTLGHVRPLTRTVADNALMLDVIAEHDPLDPGSAPAPAGHYASGLARGIRGLRIGFVRHFHETDMPADPEVKAALEQVIKPCRRSALTFAMFACRPLRSSRPSIGSSCRARRGRFTALGYGRDPATTVNWPGAA